MTSTLLGCDGALLLRVLNAGDHASAVNFGRPAVAVDARQNLDFVAYPFAPRAGISERTALVQVEIDQFLNFVVVVASESRAV
jgi:hypothetical protein